LFGYRLLRDAAKVVALSRVEAEQYRGMGVPEEKIAIIPNGIDLSEYANLPPKGSFKQKFGIKEEERIVLYLGRIHRLKGIDFLIKSFACMVKNGVENVKLVIAGPDDGYLNEAKSLVDSLGLGDRVLFTGTLSEEDKINAYADSTICTYLRHDEPFGLVPLEAAASYKPVIVADGTVMSEIVNRGGFGFSVRYGDNYKLAETMGKMLTDDELLREMGQRGRKYVFKNCDWANVVAKLEKVYEEIAGSQDDVRIGSLL
jgi:glycosyltransferase involved in cell wall biosynthesis